MANTKSALKAIRVSEKRRQRGQPVRTSLKTYVKKAVRAVTDVGPSAAEDAVRAAVRALDKAAGKGIIHRNNAARRKSRLMKRLNKPAPSQ